MSNKLQEAKDKLAIAAVAAKSRGMGDWDNFLVALREYDDELKKLLVQSPVDSLQVMQGRARECANLLSTFENCRSIAEAANQQKAKKT